jgi:hypothetical protein
MTYYVLLQTEKKATELINEQNDVISDTDSILEMEYTFYKKLYSCVDVNVDKMEDFLQSVNNEPSVAHMAFDLRTAPLHFSNS